MKMDEHQGTDTADDRSDMIVVGSGFAGMTAAFTALDAGLSVTLLERADLLGGTTAFSGGMVWVPQNRHMAEFGVSDSREEALEYIDGLVQGRSPAPELIEEYVDGLHEVTDYLEDRAGVPFIPSRSWSDYHADRPGGKPYGRSIEPGEVPVAEELGEWADRVRTSPHMPLLTSDEMTGVADVGQEADSVGAGPGIGSVGADRIAGLLSARGEKGIAVGGRAAIAHLLKECLDLGLEVHTGTRVLRLQVLDGAVRGVVAEQDGKEVAFGAELGVLLACGGFEWNEELVRAFINVPRLWPLSPPTNEGDGLLMGLEAGAAIGNMSATWSYPATSDGHSEFEGRPMSILSNPRYEAGVIAVNKEGHRFVNEAVSYMDLTKAHRQYDPVSQSYPNEAPVWLIFDSDVRDRVSINDFKPDAPTPDWVHEGATIEELAATIGLDPETLVSEVERFNGHVRAGSDPDFGRGTVWFEGWTSGGPSAEKCLAEISRGPFFAMPLVDGILGTAGGLRIDRNGQVISRGGDPIEGLYAAGNAAASMFGASYPGGGVTLGQGILFGNRAARHLAARVPARSAR
jgi:3-oxosteroid 1-dehydrogenase